MKKLLLVTTVPDTFQFILKGQPKQLAKSFDVAVAADQQPLLQQFASEEGVTAYPIAMKRGISPLHDLKSVWQMYRLLKRLRPDVMHSYTPKAGLICALAGFMARVPVRIHTFTGLLFPTAQGAKRLLLRSIDTLVCRLNTHIVPEGQGVLQELKAICLKPMQVIGHGNIAGVDLNYFNPKADGLHEKVFELRQRFQLQQFRSYCFVGRINKDKGLMELCQAFIAVNTNRPCKLLIVGGFEDENPVDDKTRQIIEQHPNIVYLGFQADVRPAMLACDVFIWPSYREGFPNVVLQAGALAKPCLVTDVPGSNEIITPDVNGWIVPARDAGKLTRQLENIQQLEQSFVDRMGAAGRENVTSKFERGWYQQELIKYYQQVIL